MTFKEKLAMEHPEAISDEDFAGCKDCPHAYGYDDGANGLCVTNGICDNEKINDETCTKCWNREMPEGPNFKYTGEPIAKAVNVEQTDLGVTITTLPYKPQVKNEEPRILDSGDRTEFETGAVRDMREGKGRCDLLPLDVVIDYIEEYISIPSAKPLYPIYDFQQSGEPRTLLRCLYLFAMDRHGWNLNHSTMLLEVAKHFEEGAKKYGDNNWRKGIPVRCYIDSAVRHYLKYLRGDKDEPHDRAFCWNILCAIWTCKHMPELNDYRKEEENGKS